MKRRVLTAPRRAAQREATRRLPRSAFTESFGVHQDYYGKTCILIARANHAVRFISLGTDTLRVEQKGAESFQREWQPLHEYPVERAALIYCAHARLFGANDEAWNWLQQIIVRTTMNGETLPAFHEDVDDMANPQKPLRDPAFQQELSQATAGRGKGKAAMQQPPPPAPTRRSSRATAAEANGTVSAPQKAERQSRGPTASSRFKELIMGTDVKSAESFGWNDDQIFQQVQSEFQLDDNKRSYVAWYRNDLRKKGENPPEAIKGVKASENGEASAPTRSRRQPVTAPTPAPTTRAPRTPRRTAPVTS